jgi:predicted RNA-binding Zn-ribbon protein involved in translation (DUF1610 family)
MAAKAGETAQKTGDFYCASCTEKIHVTTGDTIPWCPNGHESFDTRRNEPDNTCGQAMTSRGHTTTDHDGIRRWVEEHDGKPASGTGTDDGEEAG